MWVRKVSVGIGVAVLLSILLLAAACAPQTPAPGTDTSPAETPGMPPGGGADVADYAGLVAALEAAGAQVEPAGDVEQPFFSVPGQLILVDGAEVQVFEYADEAARQAESDTISEDGSRIGNSIVTWVDQPHFWAEGRLIVLYVGSDQQVVDRLTAALGPSITSGNLPPVAAIVAQQQLSQQLGVPVEEIDFVSFEQVDWTDSCLGLGQANESCAAVITPGWRVVLSAGGQQYEVRTDETGSVVRIAQGQ